MNPQTEFDLSAELEEVLRTWASAQAPERDFARWKMAAFRDGARVRNELLFSPGELVLCRPAPERSPQLARSGMLPAMAIWSHAASDEVLVPPALLELLTGPFAPEDFKLPEPAAPDLKAA